MTGKLPKEIVLKQANLDLFNRYVASGSDSKKLFNETGNHVNYDKIYAGCSSMLLSSRRKALTQIVNRLSENLLSPISEEDKTASIYAIQILAEPLVKPTFNRFLGNNPMWGESYSDIYQEAIERFKKSLDRGLIENTNNIISYISFAVKSICTDRYRKEQKSRTVSLDSDTPINTIKLHDCQPANQSLTDEKLWDNIISLYRKDKRNSTVVWDKFDKLTKDEQFDFKKTIFSQEDRIYSLKELSEKLDIKQVTINGERKKLMGFIKVNLSQVIESAHRL